MHCQVDDAQVVGIDAWKTLWEFPRIMEKKMETTIVYWGYNGIMENKMETTIENNPESLMPKTCTVTLNPSFSV